MMFAKILVANRGEIACRVLRAARRLGYRTVAVYSEADAHALHLSLAEESHCIGPAPARASYLDIDAIVHAARATGADAVHPGYGFLSESADFAEACLGAGLAFIGPPPDAMRAMGNKSRARWLMRKAGVRCTPGYDGEDPSDTALEAAAADIGYPVMIKAAAGGGGRGMRRVERAADMPEALRSARSEAEKAFGSGELLLERALEGARHIEVQVLADRHANVVHLGERDCSVQRRHQKLIEEAPAPGLAPEVRARLGQAAVTAARAIDYVGAGTVEFLLDRAGDFHFMEMNTRLQVEHPVTELVTGLDLVEWQIRVARGEWLPFAQEHIAFRGHAMEARLCAEDPLRDFLPASGPVALWRPSGSVRVDHGLKPTDAVPPHYDSMLAKLVAWGETRDEARSRLALALRQTVLLGVASNRAFLLRCLAHPEFAAGAVNTAFVGSVIQPDAAEDPAQLALAAVLVYECGGWNGPDEWFNWRSCAALGKSVTLECRAGKIAATIEPTGRHAYRARVDGNAWTVRVHSRSACDADVEIDGVRKSVAFAMCDGTLHLALPERDLSVRDASGDRTAAGAGAAGGGEIRSPMNARVAAVNAAPGQSVAQGEVLLVLEAMKMEHPVASPVAGRVAELHVERDAQVAPGALLARIEVLGTHVRRRGPDEESDENEKP